jgi:Mrp family chromosome partitioning ATPase
VDLVSSHYEAIRRIARGSEKYHPDPGTALDETVVDGSTTVVPLPAVHGAASAVARAEGIRQLCERLAPLAVVDNSMRLLVSGCRPGDGTSTIAAALALDLSQRLSLRTMLVDAHLRHPTLHRLFARPGSRTQELILDGALQIRSTGRPRLELVSCCLTGSDEERRQVLAQFEDLLGSCPAVVVDLGVARLDSRMLPLARPTDPILLTVRYGQTKRQELATTAAALRAANRAVAGVVLNAATNPVAQTMGKINKQ